MTESAVSIVTPDGQQTEWPGDAERAFWEDVRRAYRSSEALDLRDLAMHQLRLRGWTLQEIGNAFNIHRGNVSRRLRHTEADIARRMNPPHRAA